MSQERAVGLDPGTMFFQSAEITDADGNMELKAIRNAFVELEATEDIEEILSKNDWQYVYDEKDKKYFVLGDDALKVAKMFPGKVELRRPLQDGVLNKGENKKMLVLNKMIETSIGKGKTEADVVCTCVSSESADASQDSVFHRQRLHGMFKNAGWNVKIIEEAQAVILSEAPTMLETQDDGSQVEVPYSGIGLSFGAGRVNCVLSYKGMQIIGASVARSGDWIDNMASQATDTPLAQITSIKERKLDFDNLDTEDDVVFALDAYYSAMIEYVFKLFAKKFQEVKSQFDGSLDVVAAGGTTMPKGFIGKLEKVIRGMDLPFEIKEVKHADDPRNAVVRGCLTQAIIYQRKVKKELEEARVKAVEAAKAEKKTPKKDVKGAVDDLEGIL